MRDNILPILCGVALVLLLLLLPAQWRARNTGTLINIAWLFAGNLIWFVNAIAWRDSLEDPAPVWCDISVKLQAGLATGLSAASLCITRRLSGIASSRLVAMSQKQKRIALALDLAIGVGIPAVVMTLSYIVQPHRFNILEGYGCEFYGYSSLPAFFLYFMWPLVISTISAVYGGIAIYHFVLKRLEFRNLLRASKSGIDVGHFIRLMCIASADLAVGIPLDIYLIIRASEHVLPWVSWEETHYQWSYIGQVPASQWMSQSLYVVDFALPRYVAPVLTFLFFALIGATEDAITDYLRYAKWLLWILGVEKRPTNVEMNRPVALGSSVIAPKQYLAQGDIESALSSPVTDRYPSQSMAISVRVDREVV